MKNCFTRLPEKQQVLEQAKQQGYMEGMSRAQAHEGAMEQEYQEKARLLEEEYEQQIEMLEPNLVEAITGIYEHIFHVELSSYRDPQAWHQARRTRWSAPPH